MTNVSTLIDRFIGFYSRFDNRLRRISRERITVRSVKGGVQLSCTYYGCKYSQVYNIKNL